MDNKIISILERHMAMIQKLELRIEALENNFHKSGIKSSNPIPDVESLMSIACDGWIDIIERKGASKRELRDHIYTKVRHYLKSNYFILSVEDKDILISRLDTQTLSPNLLARFHPNQSSNALKIIREIIHAVIINYD